MPSARQAAPIATTSACSVGSCSAVTRLVPRPATFPSRATIAPNGPPWVDAEATASLIASLSSVTSSFTAIQPRGSLPRVPAERTLTAVMADLEAQAAVLEPGARLPSVRELMATHRVGPVTVQRAVAQLAARGVLEPRPGRGTYVAPRAPAPDPPDLDWQTLALGPSTVSAGGLRTS